MCEERANNVAILASKPELFFSLTSDNQTEQLVS